MKIENIGRIAVVGFGTMGRQITQLVTQYGFSVCAMDINDRILKSGLEKIKSGRFGLETAVERGKLTEEAYRKVLKSIELATDMAKAVKGADIVIEAAYENLDLKKDIFKELDELCPEEVVLATNTSTLSITEIGAATERPERVVGMHFFNPAQIMKLVEIVKGLLTSEEAIELARNFAIKLGKVPITVADSPGFVTSRLGLTFYLEASRVLEEGVASIRDIDIGMRLAYRHPMGPFELVDIVGLDSRLRNLKAMYDATGDHKWRIPTLLKQLVSSGYLGDPEMKPGSKGGYYEYFKLKRPGEE